MLQEASKLPVNLIEVIEAIIDYLANLLAGIVSPKDEEEFNAKELLDEIKEKVTDLLGKIETLPVPKIPILSDLTPVLELFTKMADPIVADKDTIDASVPELPNMPTAFVAMISDLWGTILNVMMMLPMILINLIFKIFEVIMGMFDSIAGIIGVPSIPYPFSLVPQIIKLLPDIWEFIANTPGKITAIVKRIIMDKFKEIQYLTLPQPSIGGIAADTSFAVCPKHEKPQTENV